MEIIRVDVLGSDALPPVLLGERWRARCHSFSNIFLDYEMLCYRLDFFAELFVCVVQ